MAVSKKIKKTTKELKKFLFIFIPVFLIVVLFFNFGAIWSNLEYELNKIFPGKTNVVGDAATIEKLDNGSTEIPQQEIKDALFIPKINLEAPISIPKTKSNKDVLNALKEGVALYPDSALPGKEGTTIINGHSSPSLFSFGKYNTVFALLNKLQKGDIITIYFQKTKYNYKVINKFIFAPQDPVLQSKNSDLLLISCWPVGTNFKRIGVEAELVQNP